MVKTEFFFRFQNKNLGTTHRVPTLKIGDEKLFQDLDKANKLAKGFSDVYEEINSYDMPAFNPAMSCEMSSFPFLKPLLCMSFRVYRAPFGCP